MMKRDSTTAPNRRLFRDPDNRMLGRVAAGLAAYLEWDITLVRVFVQDIAFEQVFDIDTIEDKDTIRIDSLQH